MKHADLSKYDSTLFDKLGVDARHVGWLASGSIFPSWETEPTQLLRELVTKIARARCLVERGYDLCETCFPKPYMSSNGRFEYPEMMAELGVSIGNAEHCVPSCVEVNRAFMAPDMILHHIRVHRYMPPGEFVDSILNFDADLAPSWRHEFMRYVN